MPQTYIFSWIFTFKAFVCSWFGLGCMYFLLRFSQFSLVLQCSRKSAHMYQKCSINIVEKYRHIEIRMLLQKRLQRQIKSSEWAGYPKFLCILFSLYISFNFNTAKDFFNPFFFKVFNSVEAFYFWRKYVKRHFA